MAKRKRTHKRKTTHRRRRSGLHGVGGGLKNMTPVLIQIAEGVGGAIGASFVTNKFLANMAPDKPNMKHLVVMGASVAAVLFIKNDHVKAVAIGAGSYAGLQLAKTAIPGVGDLMIGEVDSIMENLMIGAADPTIAGEYPMIEDAVMIDENITEDITEDANY
jgi:hypothetical protein